MLAPSTTAVRSAMRILLGTFRRDEAVQDDVERPCATPRFRSSAVGSRAHSATTARYATATMPAASRGGTPRRSSPRLCPRRMMTASRSTRPRLCSTFVSGSAAGAPSPRARRPGRAPPARWRDPPASSAPRRAPRRRCPRARGASRSAPRAPGARTRSGRRPCWEVEEEGGARDVGLVADLLDRHRVDAAGGEQAHRRAIDLVASARLAPRVPAR